MMKSVNCALAVALGVLATAAPTPAGHVVHERREISNHWERLGRVHQDLSLPMRIGLAQNNLDDGHDLLMDVSDPVSPNYGKHLTAEEVIDLFAPSNEAVEAVRAWLESSGIDRSTVSLSVNKQWLQFDAPSSRVEELFQAEFHFFQHRRTGKASIACDEYSVPHHIQDHIDYITPGIKLFAPDAMKPKPGDIEKRVFGVASGKNPIGPILKALPLPLASILAEPGLAICDVAIIPSCIAAMYNITQATLSHPSNQLGIFEDLGQYYSKTDLDLFFASLASNIPQGTHPKLEGIDGAPGATTPEDAGAEADLDFEISYPIIYPQNSVLFQTDDAHYEANYTYDGFLNNFLDGIDGSYCTYSAYGETGNSPLDPPYPDPAAGGYHHPLQCGAYKPTNVISISYGGQEADLPMSYQRRQCNEFMKLGLQGVSIVLASGDSGVAGPAGDDNADGCLGPNGTIFSPDFPGTCPYLTTVGATYLPVGASAAEDQETAVTRFPSGGGFSNIYPIPSYQKADVENYLTKYKPPYKSYSTHYNKDIGANGGIYNRNGRGYPDVSAIGDNVVIFYEGAPTLVGGTSCAAPVFASILTRINEERIAANKSTVGFVNPTLYKNPHVLHDITVGNNSGCGTGGFKVEPGWDPVTGLGTPDYPKMLELFMSLD